MPRFDYQLAVGNNNAAGLGNIESIIPSSNIAFPPPLAQGHRNPGLRKIRGNGLTYLSGYASQVWRMIWLTHEQYAYLKTTYCSGGYSGLVTVRTRYGNAAYFNANAVLSIPFESDLAQSNVGWGYRNVELTFARLVAL